MSKYNIRPATLADITATSSKPMKSIRGFAIDWNGELAAIAGVVLDRDRCIFFSDIKGGLEIPKMTIWRAAKDVVRLVSSWGIPIIAMANDDLTHSCQFLERLGFSFVGTIENEKIYRL